MYGQDDNNGQQPGGNTPPPTLDAPMTTDNTDMPGDSPSAQSGDAPASMSAGNDAGNYMMTDPPAPTTDEPTETHEHSNVSPVFNDNASSASDAPNDNSSGSTDELLDLKQQALQQLAPLVSHLDQSPEDEFRTTMMMIQASDNKDLLPKAYEAAQKITDDKVKAQALLDVVNEINYFTQAHNQDK